MAQSFIQVRTLGWGMAPWFFWPEARTPSRGPALAIRLQPQPCTSGLFG